MSGGLTASQVLQTMRDAIATDTDVAAYVTAEFSTTAKVYLGFDFENPPESSVYPLISVLLIGRARQGHSGRTSARVFEVGVAIRNETITESGSSYTYEGLLQAEDLRELVELAIIKKAGTLGKIDAEGATIAEFYFPVFSSTSFMTIESINPKRGI